MSTSWTEWFVIQLLKCGPIPRHLAIIMDGNRRFAKKYQIETHIGHKKGFETLSETLRLCANLGIQEVSVYAFSIENFKRSKSEVEGLMNLAEEKLTELMKSDLIVKHQICVKLLGDISLLPTKVQIAIAKLVVKSRNNTKGILNICFAYTSRCEMLNSMKTIASGIKNQLIELNEVDEHLFEECLYTKDDPDVLIRTSGETRLSDFLLWQSSFSIIQFFKILWPEFSLWHILYMVLIYQHNYNKLKQQRKTYNEIYKNYYETQDEITQVKQRTFLEAKNTQSLTLLTEILNKEQC